MYKITWDDFRAAIILMASYKDCCKEGCECCERVMHLLRNEEVESYLRSSEFLARKLPVETAMFHNLKG